MTAQLHRHRLHRSRLPLAEPLQRPRPRRGARHRAVSRPGRGEGDPRRMDRLPTTPSTRTRRSGRWRRRVSPSVGGRRTAMPRRLPPLALRARSGRRRSGPLPWRRPRARDSHSGWTGKRGACQEPWPHLRGSAIPKMGLSRSAIDPVDNFPPRFGRGRRDLTGLPDSQHRHAGALSARSLLTIACVASLLLILAAPLGAPSPLRMAAGT